MSYQMSARPRTDASASSHNRHPRSPQRPVVSDDAVAGDGPGKVGCVDGVGGGSAQGLASDIELIENGRPQRSPAVQHVAAHAARPLHVPGVESLGGGSDGQGGFEFAAQRSIGHRRDQSGEFGRLSDIAGVLAALIGGDEIHQGGVVVGGDAALLEVRRQPVEDVAQNTGSVAEAESMVGEVSRAVAIDQARHRNRRRLGQNGNAGHQIFDGRQVLSGLKGPTSESS